MLDASQVGATRRAAIRMADDLRLSEARRGDVAIIATELATNLVRYARQGRLLLQTLSSASGSCLELVAVDSGPGMVDLHRCMQDGVSSGGTSGTGLGAVRRLSDEFDAHSTPGRGTVVVSRVRAAGWVSSNERYAIGAVSIPAPGESVCGDTWRISQKTGEIGVMVADGLGHGPDAAGAAVRAGETFDEHPFDACGSFFARAHRALTGSRGAAVAWGHVDSHGTLRYAGVGNISGTLLGAGLSRGLPTQNGTVGAHMPRAVQSFEYKWPEYGRLVMHSDGLIGRWSVESYPGLLLRHPAVMAGILYRDFLRGRDDATITVVGLAHALPTP